MTHSSSSPSDSHNESSTTTASKNIESGKLKLPPISSMDSFYQSRSWPPPATSLSMDDNKIDTITRDSNYMSIQDRMITSPSLRHSDEPAWSPVPNRSNDSHPHNHPRLDYFITSSPSSNIAPSNTTAAATTPGSYPSASLSSMERDDARFSNTLSHISSDREHHYRQNSLPQLSSFRKNSINSIKSPQQLQQPTTPTQPYQQSVFRYQTNSSATTPTSTTSSSTNYNYAAGSQGNSLSTPSLRSIENDIEEVVRHCNSLADNMNQRRGAIIENDNYFGNPTLMRPWLDDMIGRANEVLNALLRLRKHQLAAEHAKLHRASDYQNLQREDGLNWDLLNNGSAGSANGVMTLNSVRHKKRGKRSNFQNRCHSCNISETPEWRRGPDGARTLCNACGLHYAKLAKKVKQEGEAKKEMMEDRDDTSMK